MRIKETQKCHYETPCLIMYRHLVVSQLYVSTYSVVPLSVHVQHVSVFGPYLDVFWFGHALQITILPYFI